MAAKNQVVDVHGKPFNRAMLLATLLIGSFVTTLSGTALGTAIPTLMRAFDVNFSTVQWLTTIFLLTNGVMIPVSAYLIKKIPTKTLYLSSVILFTIGTIIAFVTPTDKFWMLLMARVFQALAVGITMPLMQVVAMAVFDEQSRGRAMGISGLVVGMAPAIGPTLSGWILDQKHVVFGLTIDDSWRSIFGVMIPLLVLVIIGALIFFRDVLPNSDEHLDMRSLIQSSIGFGALLYGLANVAQYGWGDFLYVILPSIIGIAAIIFFAWHQMEMKHPFLNVSVFKDKQFALTSILTALAMMAMLGVEMVLPTYLQNIHGLSPLHSGLTLLPGALMMGIISPLAGIVYDRNGAKQLAQVGFTVLLIGTLALVFIGEKTPTFMITSIYTLRMFGIAMVMMPLTASALGALKAKDTADGAAANNTLRQVSASLATALLASVMQNVTDANKPAGSLKHAADPIHWGSKMMSATLDGFHASFMVAVSFAVIGLILTLFLRKGKLNPSDKSQTEKASAKKEKAA